VTKKNNIVKIVSITAIILNILLAIGKIITGSLMENLSIISDGVHGISDIITTIIALVTVIIANKPRDESHNSGHKRFGSIGSLILSIILIIISVSICATAIENLVHCDYSLDNKTSVDSLFIVSISILSASILIKFIMFVLMYYGSKIEKSDAMRADAWHQNIDALSSVAAIISITCELFGIHFLDPILSILIVFMILHIAIEIFKKSLTELTGHSINKEERNQIIEIIKKTGGNIVEIKTYIEGEKKRVQLVLDAKDKNINEFSELSKKIKEELNKLDSDIYEITIEPQL